MHPTLKPAMRRSWRDRESLQFGLDPAHAVVLGPLDEPTARFLRLLDGTRGPELLRREAEGLGLPAERADRLLAALADGGVLEDADSVVALDEVLRRRTTTMERLRPDLASLSVVHRAPGAAAGLMTARRRARVQVRGAGRVGASVAAVLAAAGVGRVDVVDGGLVEPWDTAPAGVSAAQVGERRSAAARAATRRAWPDPRPSERSGRTDDGGGPEPPLDLAVLAPRDGLGGYAPDPREAESFQEAGIPHLFVGVLEAMGSVGPLVVPGVTGCAGCLEAARAELDPAWPRMLAQLRSGRPPTVVACDVALATLVAGLAAAQALAFLDWRVSHPSAEATAGRKNANGHATASTGIRTGIHAGAVAADSDCRPARRSGASPRPDTPVAAARVNAGRVGVRQRPGGAARGRPRETGRTGSTPIVSRPDGIAPPGSGSRTEFSLTGLGMTVSAVAPHAGCGCGAVGEEVRSTMAV